MLYKHSIFFWLSIHAWVASLLGGLLLEIQPAQSLPPAEDVPEEVLRTEVITDARSPVDGTPLTAAEYAELQAELQSLAALKPQVAPNVQQLVTLLRLRKALRSIFPPLRLLIK